MSAKLRDERGKVCWNTGLLLNVALFIHIYITRRSSSHYCISRTKSIDY